MSGQANAQYLSPMERWEREDLRQSQWNNIASYTALPKTMGHVPSQNMQGQEDNWSITVNAKSEK
jgi:hypothetical protein